jgi:glycosyltransferase involved in cell wall biosynthesis
MSFELTILVPVYNESPNIAPLTAALAQYLKEAAVPSLVLFIDDGSTDDSLNLLKEACEKHPQFRVIALDNNYGLSTALKAGFDYTETEWIAYLDADLQTHPKDLNQLLPYRFKYDLVNGLRINRKDGFLKKLSSKIANRIRKVFTKDGMQDTGCPLKVIRTSYAKQIPMFRGLHRFLPAMILLQNGRIIEVPVRHFPRKAGKTKFGFWNRSLGPLSDCFAFLWMKQKYIRYEVRHRTKKQ